MAVDAAAGVAFGHRRLAVIDCSPTGHQPMDSADGRFVVVTNGELYNFVELRRRLEAAGYRFRGTSDTEVLVAGIERWGLDETLVRANGMFALAVWDRQERMLRLARDRFGEKPLYYGWAGPALLFGSELKALRAHPGFRPSIDRDALCLYFRHNCIPAPYSVFQGVRKVLPGTVVTFGPDTAAGAMPAPVPYWSLRQVAEAGLSDRETMPAEDWVAELDRVLGEAVRIRMRSDVPLGAFLSGGIDSSLVVALMQAQESSKVRTFTVSFDDAAFDEAAHARAVAHHLGTEHLELTVRAEEALATIPSLPILYDEPFADSSQVPQALLAAATRRFVTVALSGDGGDELFGGYNRYAWAEHFWPRLAPLPRPVRRGIGRALGSVSPGTWDSLFDRAGPILPPRLRVRMPGTKMQKVARVLAAADLGEVHHLLASHFDDPASLVLGGDEPATLLTNSSQWPAIEDPVERMFYLDAMTYLPDDILTKVDRATMAVNLETRLPFLDPAVAGLAWRLPRPLRVGAGTGKWAVRTLLKRYVPVELVERPKAGFGIPVASWLRGALRPWAEDLLAPDALRIGGILAPEPVRRLWDEHLSGRRDRAYELWDVLMLQAWLAGQTSTGSG